MTDNEERLLLARVQKLEDTLAEAAKHLGNAMFTAPCTTCGGHGVLVSIKRDYNRAYQGTMETELRIVPCIACTCLRTRTE